MTVAADYEAGDRVSLTWTMLPASAAERRARHKIVSYASGCVKFGDRMRDSSFKAMIIQDMPKRGLVNFRSRFANTLRRKVLLMLAVCCAVMFPPHFNRSAGVVDAAAADVPKDAPRRSYKLQIEKRKLAGSPNTLRVTRGEIVELQWTTDEATTLHLHGYNIELPIEPGKPGVMTFEAYAAGRFPMEAHGFKGGPRKETTLLYLEVYPR